MVHFTSDKHQNKGKKKEGWSFLFFSPWFMVVIDLVDFSLQA